MNHDIKQKIKDIQSFIKETEKERTKYAGWSKCNYADFLTGEINKSHKMLERLQNEKWLKEFSQTWKENQEAKSSDIERLIKLARA